MLNALRLLMSARGFSWSSHLASETLPKLFRVSNRVLPKLHPQSYTPSTPFQLRVPRTLSPARLRLFLRAEKARESGMMEPSSKRPRQEPGSQQKAGGGRKKKPVPPEVQIRIEIQIAAKLGDIAKALAAYDKAKAEGIQLTVDSYATLFYVCSGGDNWESALTSNQDGGSNVTPEVIQRAQGIFQEMLSPSTNLQPNEICYTAIARMAALTGNPDEAFDTVKELQARKLIPRLRSFVPALVAYAEKGDYTKAFEVDAAITAAGLEPTEQELSRLLQAAAHGASWQDSKSVLLRMSQDLTELQPLTIERIKDYFNSKAAQSIVGSVSSGASSWKVENCAIDVDGRCSACGGVLKAVDLSEEEYEAFKEGVAAIAKKQERHPNDFENFKKWLEEHGPFHAVVDAANIAFFGQNFEAGGFSFPQIRAVVNHMKSRHADSNLLVVLHVNRTKGPAANKEDSKALLEELNQEHSFYATPMGSNDDWYWIYAAVAAGDKGLLVSNDEMRDHIFQLLTPKFFLKWKQRHQVKYKFGTAGLSFEYPPPYTTCTQELSETGSWVFPCVDGTWTCAHPTTE